MSKRDFIALADVIRKVNTDFDYPDSCVFSLDHLQILADFCASRNPNFKRERWLDYINGKCGPNGGKV